MNEESNLGVKVIVGFVVLLVAIIILLLINPFVTVSSQQVGIIREFGAVKGTIDEGLSIINPFTQEVIKMDISTLKEEAAASAASIDQQVVSTTVTLNYEIDKEKAEILYRAYENDHVARLIQPMIQEAVKGATAKYTAEELLTKREEVKGVMYQDLKNRLAAYNINVKELLITNFDFSPQFNAAIEAKVTAEQEAQKAKNDLARVEFEAQQSIERAKAEAEAIRIQAEAITSQGGAEYVKLKAIEKWNGDVPSHMIPNATVPFIDLN